MEIGEGIDDEKKKKKRNKVEQQDECPSCSCGSSSSSSSSSSKKLPSLRQVLGLPKVIPDNAESGPDSATFKEAGAALSSAIPYSTSSSSTTNARITGALYPYYTSHSSNSHQGDIGRSLHGASSSSYSPANSRTAAAAAPLQAHPIASTSTSTLNTYGYNDIAAAAESPRYRQPSWLLKRQDAGPSCEQVQRYTSHCFQTEDENRVCASSSASSVPYPVLGTSRYATAGQVDRDVDMYVVDEPENYEVEGSAYQGDEAADLGMDGQQQRRSHDDDYNEDESERYRRYRRGDGKAGRHPHPQKGTRTSSNGEDAGSHLPLLPLPLPPLHSHSHAHSSSHTYTAHRSPVISANSPGSSHQHSPTLSLPLSLPLPLSSSSSSNPTTAAPTPSLREDVSRSPSAALPPLALALNPDIVQTAHLLASIAELGVSSPSLNPTLSNTGSGSVSGATTCSTKSSSSAARAPKPKAKRAAPVPHAAEKQARDGAGVSGSKTKNSAANRTASTSPRASNDHIPTFSTTAASPQNQSRASPPNAGLSLSRPAVPLNAASAAAAAASLLSALALPSYTSPASSSKPGAAGFDEYLEHPRGSNSLTLPFENSDHNMRHLQSPLASSGTGTATTDSNSSSYFAFSSPAASTSTSSIPRQGGRGAAGNNNDALQGSQGTTPEDRHSTIIEEDEEDQDEDDEGDEEYHEPPSQNGGHPPAESVGCSSGEGGGAGSSSSTWRYACTVCNKYFSRPSALAVHSHMYTGEKPFTCTICHRSFSVNSNLKRHFKTHSKAPSGKML